MGIRTTLKKQALAASQKAMEKLLSDEKRALQFANAIGSMQRGKKALDRSQDELLRAFSFAPQSDFKAVSKQLAGLKRRLRDLEGKLDSIGSE